MQFIYFIIFADKAKYWISDFFVNNFPMQYFLIPVCTEGCDVKQVQFFMTEAPSLIKTITK